MKLYIKNSDIIESVSLWGVTDNRSWRSAGLPLLFDPNGKAKPAYYSFIKALEQ
jgi:endo-1,4-beta-xylanase